MIHIITIDEHGDVSEQRLFNTPNFHRTMETASDLIYIRPDWPPIGSTDFADRLRAWHAQHNNDARPAGN